MTNDETQGAQGNGKPRGKSHAVVWGALILFCIVYFFFPVLFLYPVHKYRDQHPLKSVGIYRDTYPPDPIAQAVEIIFYPGNKFAEHNAWYALLIQWEWHMVDPDDYP
ncbi:MAG TPA: hypothetical protein VG733_02830 [Chthoniobacteraceae bacterium]|nr:hypothetical protein [Chthoniobacteraceae bacterium]